MKKYKVVKWLVLSIALFTFICFFTPFVYWSTYWEGKYALLLGIYFVIGASFETVTAAPVAFGIWMSRLSFVIAIAAVVFAVLPFISKDEKGLNKQGKFHKTLVFSTVFSLLSCLINLVSMLVIPYIEEPHYYEYYSFIGLIPVAIIAIVIVVLCVKVKSEIANIKVAPQVENTVNNKATNPVVTQPKPETAKSVARPATVSASQIEKQNAVSASVNESAETENTVIESVASSATVSASQTEKQNIVSESDKKSNPISKLFAGVSKLFAGASKFIKGFAKGISRANKTIYGDIEGPMTKLKSGKRPISLEDGKCIAWIVGQDDIVLSKENVKGLELTCEHKEVSITNCRGATSDAAIYTITMRNGEVGTLRLVSSLSDYVLQAINAETSSTTTTNNVVQTPQQATTVNSPKGKPLEWFSSEAGLDIYKAYITPQNYMLEEFCKEEHKQKCADADFDEVYLPVYHEDAKLPRTFFKALIKSIGAQPLLLVGPCETLIMLLESLAKPYELDDDGEPILRNPLLTPEQIISVEKNPLLNFVKNFDVFELKDDVVGTAIDKYNLYKAVLIFLSVFAGKIIMEENQWLFDKNTYLNDFGTVRKEKGFLKKCKEMTNDADFISVFDEYLSKLN